MKSPLRPKPTLLAMVFVALEILVIVLLPQKSIFMIIIGAMIILVTIVGLMLAANISYTQSTAGLATKAATRHGHGSLPLRFPRKQREPGWLNLDELCCLGERDIVQNAGGARILAANERTPHGTPFNPLGYVVWTWQSQLYAIPVRDVGHLPYRTGVAQGATGGWSVTVLADSLNMAYPDCPHSSK